MLVVLYTYEEYNKVILWGIFFVFERNFFSNTIYSVNFTNTM